VFFGVVQRNLVFFGPKTFARLGGPGAKGRFAALRNSIRNSIRNCSQ